jgi:hypothetical protein
MSDDAEKAITDAIEAGTPIINLTLQMPLTLTLGPKGSINIDSAIAVPGFDKAAIQRAVLHAPLRELRLALEVLEAGEEDRVIVAVNAT